ncbi:HD domain-containing phosphohydrolase [Clostridium pasteurianum]|uniref:Response regulator containing a CheY-like receiver domain and an HD-GYP domain n=1 Tax=Clostridium pasteurianum BC1 TaxID=86416 RepID=R4K6X7_CLOPA|nr:HD domain-containing phosphohydrolase [Clostridium pasteurianum]AGK96274.1 response regulator containing a CheY-like receiver domain and an HD-GYP domain [Clostridium pasteurianum BC1]
MYTQKNKSILRLYREQLAIIVILLTSAIIVFFSLLMVNIHRNHQGTILSNSLSEQITLTQIMAKDSNRVFEIESLLQVYNGNGESKESLQNKVNETLEDLKQAENSYIKQYNLIKQGYIVQDNAIVSFKGMHNDNLNNIFIRHDKIWPQYYESINIVFNNKSNLTELLKATRYINENNQMLLDYNEKMANLIKEYDNNKTQVYINILTAVGILILIILAVFMTNTYINLFLPMNQFYRGMTNIGINDLNVAIPKFKREELKPVFYEVQTVFDKLKSLINIIEDLSKNLPFKDILDKIFNSFQEYVPYTYIGVALIEDDGQFIKASYASAGKEHENLSKRMLGIKAKIISTSLHKILKDKKARLINDLEEYVKGKNIREYNKILLEEGIKSSITFPLINNDKPIGIIFFSSNQKNIYKKEHIEFLKIVANSIMLSLEEDILIEDMVVSSTLALAVLTEERDPETGEHLDRMKIYSRMLAEYLSKEDKYKDTIDMTYINSIERFSPLHDIGKVAIRDDILLKPGKLTEEEFKIMKTHTTYGGKVLRLADENLMKKGRSVFKMAIEIAEGHHEWWNGTGYPYGRNGEEIPLSARIVSIADVFDALTSKRPYKKAFSFEDSIEIIAQDTGKHFDPYITEVFFKNIDKFRVRYKRFNRHHQ